MIKKLGKEGIDITKEHEEYGLKWWANQVEHGLIDGSSLVSEESAIVLDSLFTLHTMLTSADQTKTIINEPSPHDKKTCLHNLINRHGSTEDPKTSKGTSLNCLPHINVLLKHGANPKLKASIRVGSLTTGEEKDGGDFVGGTTDNVTSDMTAIEQAAGGYTDPAPTFDPSIGDEYKFKDRDKKLRINIHGDDASGWNAEKISTP